MRSKQLLERSFDTSQRERKAGPQTDTAEPRRLHVYGRMGLGVMANEIRSRVAADFRDWEKRNSNFAQQVDRVIKALRADEGARELPPPPKL